MAECLGQQAEAHLRPGVKISGVKMPINQNIYISLHVLKSVVAIIVPG